MKEITYVGDAFVCTPRFAHGRTKGKTVLHEALPSGTKSRSKLDSFTMTPSISTVAFRAPSSAMILMRRLSTLRMW